MQRVQLVYYSVIFNKKQLGYFFPKRGLRPGDPLAPYLFLICAEGLATLLQVAERGGRIHDVSIGKGCPQVSHLCFADDSLFFFNAKIEFCAVRHMENQLAHHLASHAHFFFYFRTWLDMAPDFTIPFLISI